MIYCIRKNKKLNLIIGNKDNKSNKDNNNILYSFNDLYYDSLSDFIDEYNSNKVLNIFGN